MHIALFGTSADPPHQGHCEILRWLATQFDHVAVWASDNPFKTHQSPLGDRSAMLRLMIGDIPAPVGRSPSTPNSAPPVPSKVLSRRGNFGLMPP